ncbi:cis-prenyltransferase [Mitosporidium daphniae]
MDRLLVKFGGIMSSIIDDILIPLVIYFVKLGPVPKHISFIMDGNRRWSRQKRGFLAGDADGVGIGHLNGYKALEKILKWCLLLDVECVTLYAFSIENFKRSTQEVSFLMSLAMEKCKLLSMHSSLVKEKSVSIRVIGDMSLAQEDMRNQINETISMTKGGKRILNIAFLYTSTNEIERAVCQKTSAKGCDGKIDGFLDTAKGPPLDLLIRTSGEHRLSDFMMWQITSQNTLLLFDDTLWPDFSFLNLIWQVLQYQYFKFKSTVSVK